MVDYCHLLNSEHALIKEIAAYTGDNDIEEIESVHQFEVPITLPPKCVYCFFLMPSTTLGVVLSNSPTGVFVKQFSSPSSLAQSTGQIQVGDVLLAIDSLPVNTTLDAKNLISHVGVSRIPNTKTNRPVLSFSRRCVV